MIYLIQSAYVDESDNFHKALKIGYAKDLDKRLTAYNTHLPSYKLLKSREGDEELEKHLHSYFSKYRISNYEWFEYSKDIIEDFDNITLDTILPSESITYEPKVNKPSFANRKNKKDPKIIKIFQELYFIFQTSNSDIDKIIKEELEKIDLRLYISKIHIDTWKNFYDSFTNLLKEKIEGIIKEQEQFNSLSFIYLPSYITLPIINTEFALISKEDFIEKLVSFKRVSINQEKILIDQFISEFDIDKNFGRRIKLLCDFLDKYPNYVNLIEIDPRVPRDYTFYYKIIGTDKIRSVGYKESDIRNFIDHIIKRDKISGEIIFTFLIGNKYTNKYIKEKLQEIYDQNNIKKVAKAKDIEDYLITKRSQFVTTNIDGTKKKVDGIEIISLK